MIIRVNFEFLNIIEEYFNLNLQNLLCYFQIKLILFIIKTNLFLRIMFQFCIKRNFVGNFQLLSYFTAMKSSLLRNKISYNYDLELNENFAIRRKIIRKSFIFRFSFEQKNKVFLFIFNKMKRKEMRDEFIYSVECRRRTR